VKKFRCDVCGIDLHAERPWIFVKVMLCVKCFDWAFSIELNGK
jgi:hypothetical protein